MQLFERLGISPEPFHMDKTSDEQEAELHQTLADVKTDSQFYRAG
jgi:biotin synthase